MNFDSYTLNFKDDFQEIIQSNPELQESLSNFKKGQVILNEGEKNDSIYILLQGEVTLHKELSNGNTVEVDYFTEGAILGLTSFIRNENSFVNSIATTDVTCLVLNRDKFQSLSESNPQFTRLTQNLFINNLAHRYRNMVSLNLEVQNLTQALEIEKAELKKTIEDLQKTREQLVHHEKLATLGQHSQESRTRSITPAQRF